MTACCISRRFRLNSYQPLKLIPEKLDLFSAQQKIFFVSNMTSPSSSDDATNEWTSVDPSELSGGARYGLCISSVVPRPVAVISSISESGVVNCAPFSYSGICGHDPPIVSHGLCLKAGQKKDTLVNIEETKEWVFNILTTKYLEQANSCAANLPPDIDEAKEANMRTISSDVVKAPRLADAAVSLECKLFKAEEIFNDEGKHSTTIVLGRVVKIHIHQSVLKEGSNAEKPLVDLQKLQPVGRAGDITYFPVGVHPGSTVSMARPK